jgi:5-methyltetrahydrofolate--homocysteine methyltransferase
LFSLRGEELLYDLTDYPSEVSALESRLNDEWLKCFWQFHGLIKPIGHGFTTWMPLVSDFDKPYYPIQCDFCVMISPQMFERFVLPSLDRVSRDIGCAVYHLDGPEEIRHLDMILSLEHVHAIQWTPLPQGGKQYFNDKMSLEVYRRAKAAGKKAAVFHVDPGQVADIYNAAGPDGMFILSNCKTRKEADDLIECAQNNNWIR